MNEKSRVSDSKRKYIFINILISCIASSMLSTALTTALPPIMKDFQITAVKAQWITSGFSLAMGIMMPLTAFLITRFSTKKLYCTAILLFIAGLAVSVSAPDFYVMMLGRVLQAIGSGILSSMAQVILLSIYPAHMRGTVMGWYGLSVSAAPVIAPTLTGVLVDHTGWKMIFYIAIIIMTISFLFALVNMRDVLETIQKKFDVLSFVLSAVAFGGLTLGIGNIGTYSFLSKNVLLVIVIGLIGTILFVWRQLKMEDPFLELRILKKREYTISVIGSMLLYLIMMGASVILPLYIQSIMRYSATISGLVTLPGSLAMAIVCPFAGKIYDKVGMKLLFIAGAACMVCSNIGMIFIGLHTSIWVACGLNMVRCVAIGCLMMPFVTWGTSEMKQTETAHATALLTSLRTIAGAIGSAIFVGIMSTVGENSMTSYGTEAQIHGLNVTFAAMTAVSLVLLGIGIFGVKKKLR